MDLLPPAMLLFAALICSIIGRAVVNRAAFSISKGWGFAIICLPLAPLFFRLRHKELAQDAGLWRMATTIFTVLFFAVAGTTGTLENLWLVVPAKLRPADYAQHREPAVAEPPVVGSEPANSPEVSEPDPVLATAPATNPPAVAAPPAPPAPAKLGFWARVVALVRPAAAPATPNPATPDATSASPTLPQRLAANQAEFTRLGVVYENLKKKRRSLKKSDQKAIRHYNAEAAEYQATLAAARAEQQELNKQRLAKK